MAKATTYPPFTKDEFAAEVREQLYIQASQISHACSDDAATAFLGFPCEFSAGGCMNDKDVARIDLPRFPAWNYLGKAFDFAFQVGNSWHYDEDTNIDVVALANGMSISAISGELSPYMVPTSKCRHVIDLAIGRFYLEAGSSQSLTVRQLALLADMSEAAVRNSLSAEKLKTPVDADVALVWLRGRKGFVPTKAEENREASWLAHTRSYLAAPRFNYGLAAIIRERGLSVEEVSEQSGVALPVLLDLLDGPVDLPALSDLTRLGAFLKLDVPHFVGQAMELALRKRT